MYRRNSVDLLQTFFTCTWKRFVASTPSPVRPPLKNDLSTCHSTSPHIYIHHQPPSLHSPVTVFTLSRCLSRSIKLSLKRRPKRVPIPPRLRLIDEEGTNLGIMSSGIAVKLADSKNLKLVEVKKRSDDSEAVYRLYTSKQHWDEAKKKKKAAKSDPANTIKDMTIFSQIGEHDLAVKLSHLQSFLERGHTARVFVQTKYRRGMNEERERESREAMVGRVAVELEGLGEKVTESPHQRRGIVCQFKPVKKVSNTQLL